MMPVVYMLQCADGKYYVGLTKAGLDKRIAEHQAGHYDGWTAKRLPVKLVWSQEFDRLTDAIEVERKLKGWRRDKKEAVIKGDFHLLPELASRSNHSPSS